MDYQEALSRLHSLTSFGIRPGLGRIETLLRRLGDPHRRIPRYIHVAGTNGKGSVCAMLDQISRAAGLRTALFTSPHLHSHTERYRVDGEPVPEADFAALFPRVLEAIDDMVAQGGESPTEFEAATAFAFLYFAERQVDLAVMEVGLGGDMDSTNVLESSLQVITNVGMDHMDYLGSTVPEIAACKAGIIKPHSQVVTAAEDEAWQVIARVAAEKDSCLWTLGREIVLFPGEGTAAGSRFDLAVAERRYEGLFLPLLGAHQLKNAALAVTAAQLAGFSEEHIRQGLARTRWPGRLEVISRQPLVVLDGAHNAPAAQVLSEALTTYWPEKRILCLMGMLADKQREEALEPLLPHFSHVVVTPPPYRSRQGDWQRLAEICRAGGVPAETVEDPFAACDAALSLLETGDYDMLLVCGSLYLLAEIRLYLLDKTKAASEETGRTTTR